MPENLLQFADFVLDRSAFELRRGDAVVLLQRIPFALLCLLVERSGQLVTREEILERVWGKGVFVDSENSINTAVRKLRRALADDPEAPRFIVTIPARGYRFIAEVHESKPATPLQPGSRSRRMMVGRDDELAAMLRGLDDAAAGRGGLFLISGEPGVGKTRLADEVATAAEGRHITVLVGHCSEHEEAVPYLPFVEILEGYIERAPNQDELRAALGEQGPELARLLPKLQNVLPGLAPPLDLEPTQARRHLFNCFFDFAARLASQRPVLIILEDLHWADDSTLSLLDHLTRRLGDVPLVIIGTYRDAESNVTRQLAKTLEDALRGRMATRLRLQSLPINDVGRLLTSLSGKAPPASVVKEIFAETGGNPFFIEELFRHLEEEERLYDSAGEFDAGLKIAELDAPPSVRLVVARRVDRLSEPTRMMLARAAVIGRFFGAEILAAASEDDGDSMLASLEEAERAGLIVSVSESPRVRFAFSHELIRQAVLAALSAVRRQRLHLEIADTIERIYQRNLEPARSGSLQDHVAELAHHYARGGSPDKAVQYYRRALQKFAELGSCAEAISQFESALEILPELADDRRRAELELDLRIAVSFPLGDSTGIASPQCERSAERAMALSLMPGVSWERTFWALYSVFWVRHLRPETRKACELAEELLAQAEQHGEAVHQAEGELSLAWARMYAGDFERADQGFDRAAAFLESARRVSDLDPRQQLRLGRLLRQLGTAENTRMVSGWNLWFLGYPERALQRMAAATDIANSGSRPMLADIHGFASYVHELRGEPELMKARAEARLAIATESGYAAGRALSEIYLGWADAKAGDHEAGITRMRRYMAEMKATGSEYITDRGLAFIALVLASMKRFDESFRTLDEAFAFVEKSGLRFYEAELHRLKGELMLARSASNTAAAEQSFRTAIEISRRQHARSWELRATTSLTRLLAKRRKRAEGHAMLAQIYHWFTEGFDTADLKEAKALLDEMDTSR